MLAIRLNAQRITSEPALTPNFLVDIKVNFKVKVGASSVEEAP
ncbi:hypothetical protein [Ectopseudomonas guguanensis]|nr:hypothetical protein [Pseudomonas guguanensis]